MTILVIGDLIEDVYIKGDCVRMSPEAPVPVISNVETYKVDGGAGNVNRNILALGSKTNFIFNEDNIVKKTRVVANNQIVCRIDEGGYKQFRGNLRLEVGHGGVAVLSDYNFGVLDDAPKIIEALNKIDVKVLVDPKRDLSLYEGAWLVKTNEKEFSEHVGVGLSTTNNSWGNAITKNYLRAVCLDYKFQHIVVTRGSRGAVLYSEIEGFHIFDGYDTKGHMTDVTGAGDVFIAALAHFTEKEYSVYNSCKFANALAGISATKFGTYVVTDRDRDLVLSMLG